MCALCPSPDDDGALEWWGEGLNVAPADATPESNAVCMRCLRWFGQVMHLAARPADMDPGVLGFPSRRENGRACLACCNFCLGELGGERFTVSLSRSRTSAMGKDWVARQYRLCRACFTWARLVVHDRGGLAGTSYREGEGGMGSWRAMASRDACSAYLDPRDAFTVEATVTEMGCRHTLVSQRCAHTCLLSKQHEHGGRGGLGRGLGCSVESALFIGAGQDGRGRQLVDALSPEQRSRTFVVARQDTLGDALESLRSGATELLASPLSPQQIAGAIDRSTGTVNVAQRSKNGIPGYVVQPWHGLSAHGFAIKVGDGMASSALLLLLRRFVRGYDLVGQWPDGKLQVVAFCAVEQREIVLERLQLAAGRTAKIELRESVAADDAKRRRAG